MISKTIKCKKCGNWSQLNQDVCTFCGNQLNEVKERNTASIAFEKQARIKENEYTTIIKSKEWYAKPINTFAKIIHLIFGAIVSFIMWSISLAAA